MKKKLKQSERKMKLTASINPILFKKLNEQHSNVSKHVEWLIYQDMRKNNIIEEMPL